MIIARLFEWIFAVGVVALASSLAVWSQTGSRRNVATAGASESGVPGEITYAQVYATSDGETHFKDVKVALTSAVTAPPAQPIAQSTAQPATTIRHAAFPAGWGVSDRDRNIFHNASERRFISVRKGVLSIRVSDGDTRQFHAGDVLEVLDVPPSKGHITWVGGEPAIALFSNHP